MSDLISRADAICEVLVNDGIDNIVDRINALPSAEAESDDLIIKGAKGIQDGLYNIKDGKLFMYKANGGTVRTYPIVPLADAVDCTELIEWLTEVVMDEENWELNAVAYGEVICRKLVELGILEVTEEPSYYIRPTEESYLNAFYDGFNTATLALSADAVQGWIPCSERLPRTGDDILVTFSDGEVDIIISARPKAWVKYEEANNLIFPVAWMPLPKPYRKDGEV